VSVFWLVEICRRDAARVSPEVAETLAGNFCRASNAVGDARRARSTGMTVALRRAEHPMRILELHSPYFRTLWRREHDVLCWGRHDHCDVRTSAPATQLTDVLAALPSGWNPDLIVFGDDSRLLYVTGLEDAPCPTLMLSVDAHHHAGWHAPLASVCDVAFVAQRDYLPSYELAGADVRWLPLWAPDDVPAPAAEKTHDVSFVGTLDPILNPGRVTFVDALRPLLPLHVASGDWRPIFGRSRIVLNQTVKADLNFRVFEAMAAGALLLTERTGNGLFDLFTDGEDLVTYTRGDVGDAVETARRYLSDERARAEIAARGCAVVRARHCERHRAAEVLARATGPLPEVRRERRLAGAARAYGMLAHYAGRLARRWPEDHFGLLREVYLAAATMLTQAPELPEPDRRAVLGIIALEREDVPGALGHLAWAATHGSRPEDHVLRVEALIRQGDIGSVREAAAVLRAAHPDYELGRTIAEGLGV
jgi:hypothetical protein